MSFKKWLLMDNIATQRGLFLGWHRLSLLARIIARSPVRLLGWVGLAMTFALATPVRADESTTEVTDPPIQQTDRQHWSFRPLTAPPIPTPADRVWPRNSIDSFVLIQLEARKLQPGPLAGRRTLIRRLYFDVCGLPPEPPVVAAFVADDDPLAYERLVDRLLASPDYGERWGQHWLDVARFAETDGFEHDKVRPEAWRYRDWVVEALNQDLPYDRFLLLQLAGDLIEQADDESRLATGFCLAGPDMPDINSQQERRHTLLNDITSVVGESLLGLQVGCAQCHDHKYDPISQLDFYRLRAFFESAVQLKKDKSVSLLARHESAPATHLMIRGDWRRPGQEVAAAFPRIAVAAINRLDSELVPDPEPIPAHSPNAELDRLALARWLTQPQHPLTARVIANRIWQHHFGHGLSRTPNDFGTMGDEPILLELLDHLASELVRGDWSLKRLHRRILTSATYRQAGLNERPDAAEILQRDPGNLYLSRYPLRRLEGEALRDAMLQVTNTLNHRRGGPGVRPPLPSELTSTLLRGQWDVSENRDDHTRRSIYLFARRNLRFPIFEAFDRPDANASCPSRNRSTTAPQSLLMLNSEFTRSMAQQLAQRLQRERADRAGRLRWAFELAIAREPTADELGQLLVFLDEQEQSASEDQRTPEGAREFALTEFCRALFNLSEFVYFD